ncbi:MAG: HD family phosphohydrolase [Saprospiraceae bacterium]|nr:HD family phosphohydrolase [Saprospiraceae bacterium]
MELYNQWIEQAKHLAIQTIRETMPAIYHFHNVEHVEQVVSAIGDLSGAAGLEERERTILILAGWFHDLGYNQGPAGHEERGANLAKMSLLEWQVPQDIVDEVAACIMATQMPQQPKNKLQSLIADADLSHLGTGEYWSFISKLRQELKEAQHREMTETEWLQFEINFLQNQSYHTPEAQALYGKTKKKHLKKLQAMLAIYDPNAKSVDGETEIVEGQKLGRGVETMFRSAYRTHINLSSIADNKANIMLSINAIIVSITVSTLVPRFSENPNLVWPTIMLLIVCLVAIIFATLSTMPKVTKGTVTRQSIEKKEANLIFFGNYFNMSLTDYQWGMNELIGDKKFIYNTMTRDLYFLGIVLAKKYTYLRWCYLVFMWGLIATVLAFGISILCVEQG